VIDGRKPLTAKRTHRLLGLSCGTGGRGGEGLRASGPVELCLDYMRGDADRRAPSLAIAALSGLRRLALPRSALGS